MFSKISVIPLFLSFIKSLVLFITSLLKRKIDSYYKFFTKYINVKRSIGITFILIGIIGIVFLMLINRNSTPLESFPTGPIIASDSYKENGTLSQVTQVIIPRLSIDLKVLPAKLVNGYWEASETTASHGEFTANPGQKGNIVLFAHAREGLFLNLKDIEKGYIIYVLTNTQWHRYKVTEIKNIYPNQVEVVNPTSYEVLTLFTCSGFFDEKRLVVHAIPL